MEVPKDMTTKCFILYLCRFISRRGYCKLNFSDNALRLPTKNYNNLKKIIKIQELKDFISNKCVT